MKVYKIPSDLKAIIFDIDCTLYTNQKYAIEQVDCQIREYARVKGMTADAARRKVAEYRKAFAMSHNGSKVSLGNTLLSFGVPIEKSIEWREKLLEPKNFLSYDETLVETLHYLGQYYKLICVTNNPVLPARKTLEAIGVSEFFSQIVGLDTCYKSKPALEPFMTAVDWLGVTVDQCLAVGDRYDMDIALPLELGMGGVLVSGVEEVYQLPEMLIGSEEE